jgi:hypothetical protein
VFETDPCPECGVPKHISNEHLWLNSGVIAQSRDLQHRLIFIESENLDPLFEGIGTVIGRPIEKIVIDTARRATRLYTDRLISNEVRGLIRAKALSMEVISDSLKASGRMLGYANYLEFNYRYEGDQDDYFKDRVESPYSLPLLCGNNLGSNNAIDGGRWDVRYEKILPEVYDITTFRSKSPPEPEGGLIMKQYFHKDGDIELKKCSSCGCPAALSEFKWYLDKGMIESARTGRRMAFIGPQMLDAIFEELTSKFGETVPRLLVEEQRRFVKSGNYSIDEVGDEENMRNQFALRGLGDLRDIEVKSKGIRYHLDNAVLHPLLVGLAQGLYEKAFHVDSVVEWELSEKGELIVEVTAKVDSKA